MRRRDFIVALAAAAPLLLWLLVARAQQEREVRAWQISVLRLQAVSMARDIEQFLNEIISQVGWTNQLPWSVGTMDQRRFDALRLLRQVPAITEVAFLDESGIEQLKSSRLATDVVSSKSDLSQEPTFKEAVAHKVYYGPPYIWRYDLYMTLSVAGTRRESGVSVAMVGLKLIWDLIPQLKVGEHGAAYVLDAEDRIIAHSAMFTPRPDRKGDPYFPTDYSLFQRDLAGFPQVQAAHAAPDRPTQVQAARDINGRDVLSVSASVPWPGWHVFVELPLAEANTAVP
jgi:hypothetical protein